MVFEPKYIMTNLCYLIVIVQIPEDALLLYCLCP